MHDIFFFTDVHGCYDLYRAVMNYCNEQDPEAMIIFGGDACDRGSSGYKIMKELLDNPYVVYLKGNHEDMFVHAAMSIKKNYDWPYTEPYASDFVFECINYDNWIYNCVHNGGAQTLIDWIVDGMPINFVHRINNLPLTVQYENLDFCHAGGDPKVYKRVVDNEYDEVLVDKEDAEIMLWDRNWLGFGWYPNRICVFGHTPTPYLPAKYYGQDKSTVNAHPCKYVGMIDDRLTGYRLDMDTGTPYSGKLYVLNCLTMKTQGFYDKDINEKEIHKHDVEKIEVIQF